MGIRHDAWGFNYAAPIIYGTPYAIPIVNRTPLLSSCTLIMSLKTKRKSLLIEDQLWHLLLLFQANGNLRFSAHAFIGKFFLKKNHSNPKLEENLSQKYMHFHYKNLPSGITLSHSFLEINYWEKAYIHGSSVKQEHNASFNIHSLIMKHPLFCPNSSADLKLFMIPTIRNSK